MVIAIFALIGTCFTFELPRKNAPVNSKTDICIPLCKDLAERKLKNPQSKMYNYILCNEKINPLKKYQSWVSNKLFIN